MNNSIVKVELIKKEDSNGVPILQDRARKTIRVTLNSNGGYSLKLSQEQKLRFFKELIPKWKGTNSPEDAQLEYEFIRDFGVKLTSKQKTIDTSTARGALEYLILLNSKDVVQNSTEIKKKPYATHIIIDENVEANIKNKNYSNKRKAFAVLDRLRTRAEKVDFLKFFNIDGVKLTPSVVDNKLYQFADETPESFVRLGEEFIDGARERAMLFEALHYKVLEEDGTGIYFHDTMIGENNEYAIRFLKDVRNSNLKLKISRALEDRKEKSPVVDKYADEVVTESREEEEIEEEEPSLLESADEITGNDFNADDFDVDADKTTEVQKESEKPVTTKAEGKPTVNKLSFNRANVAR